MKEIPLNVMASRKRRRKENITGYLFCTPGLLLLLLVGVYSIFFSITISFFNWSGVDFSTARFVGFQNFKYFLLGGSTVETQNFYSAIFHNFEIAIVSIVIIIPISLILAFLIQGSGKATAVFRTIYFIPMVASGVAVYYVWQGLFSADGVLNTLFRLLHLNFLVVNDGLLGNPHTAIIGVIITVIWSSVPGTMILYYAGLTNIDKELYDAAKIDGAGKFKVLAKITWPLIKPITVIAVIMSLNGAFQMFDNIYVLTGGGPAGSTEVVGTLIYRTAFLTNTFGEACAMGWVVFLVTLVLSIYVIKGFETDY